MLKTILARLAEPSTWAGISGLFMANTLLMGDEYRTLLGALAMVSGVIAVVLKDPGHA